MTHRIASVVGIVAIRFARQQDMQGMVNIIIPLSVIKFDRTGFIASKIARGVVCILQYEVDKPFPGEAIAHGARQLSQDVGSGFVDDRMDGIEAQAVDAVFLEPIERIVHEEIAHYTTAGSIEVDGISPWRCMATGK